jgi:branched-subunit amino acid aminotransferase/4-amino-4-deoxychorismate lyase
VRQICFVDGTIARGGEGCIPADDLGFQRSYAVFDYARTHNGKLFHIEDHLARFRRSAAGLWLDLGYTDDDIIATANDLIAELGFEEAGLRLILTGGPAHAENLLAKPRLVMIAEELPSYPDEIYDRGASLVTYEFRRDFPQVKTTNYMNAFRLEPFKREKKAFDILYVWDWRVLECPRDNFFLLKDRTLVTAKDDVLHGITRKVVMDLAAESFAIEEREVSLDEIDTANGAFMTSTTKSIVPVVEIDERKIGDGTMCAGVCEVMGLFEKYVDRY